jgi:hypothetical protein
VFFHHQTEFVVERLRCVMGSLIGDVFDDRRRPSLERLG